MDGSSLILIFIAFSTAAIIAAYAMYESELRRKAELTQIAAVRGSPFDASKDESHYPRYGHFSIFTQGQSRYAYNTIRGALDVEGESWPVQFGDYHFETIELDGKEPKPRNHALSYVLLETPYLGLPDLYIRPKGLFEKAADLRGFEEINFESAEFSNRFSVKSRDKRFAYDVLHPRMLEFLLDGPPLTIDFKRGQCCLSMGERRWSVAEFEAVLDWTSEFFALWPRHVIAAVAERIER
jgi:hypothetical protein